MASFTFFSLSVKYLGDLLLMVRRMLKRKLSRKSKRKRTRKSRCRIAELPECILESILSFIPLSDTATASLVCREWRLLLLKRSNLISDFENANRSNWCVNRQPLVSYVDKYVQLYRDNKVNSLTVDFDHDKSVLDRWFRFAMIKGVEERHLLHGCFDEYVYPQLLLSEQANAGSRVNLKNLSLCHGRIQPPPYFNGFHQLITLHLSWLRIHPSFTSNLFTIFPSLESLTLHSCNPSGVDIVDIVAGDRLTELKVRHCYAEEIKIAARNLASLEVKHDRSSSLSLKTPRLAKINLSDMARLPRLPHVLTQFATCSELQSLCLQIHPNFLINLFSMPAFGNLRKLKVDICQAPEWDHILYGYNDDILLGFLDFLKAAPLLEELVTDLLANLKAFNATEEREINVSPGFTHNHLKFVKMRSYHDHWSEIEFAVCILKCARNLKTIEIGPFTEIKQEVPYYRKKAKRRPRRPKFIDIHEKLEQVKTDARIIFLF